MKYRIDPGTTAGLFVWTQWFLVLGILLSIAAYAFARPNDVWKVQQRAAERCEDQTPQECEETLRRLHYVGTAGSLPCPEGSLTWCQPSRGFHQPCCGEADAYEADVVIVDGEGTWAVLTCNDPRNCEEIQGKVVRRPGERFLVPPARVLLNHDPVNDTGHGWVWISPSSTDHDGRPVVYCWAAPAGM